ncbi:MAG: Mu-like prophage major head subunit gpT family protein [Myxococcales bacterium]|nr:Mu-like prophage major head subunit gpT family protein [Myxococcales bacterium]
MAVRNSTSSARTRSALEDFAQGFALALTQPGVEQWAKENGLYRSSRALGPRTPSPSRRPVTPSSKGDVRVRDIFQKSLSLTPARPGRTASPSRQRHRGAGLHRLDVGACSHRGAASALLNQIIADASRQTRPAGTARPSSLTRTPSNVFDVDVGTYDNDFTGAGTTLTAANLKLAKSRMRDIKAPNGKPLGLRLTHLLIPSALEETRTCSSRTW